MRAEVIGASGGDEMFLLFECPRRHGCNAEERRAVHSASDGRLPQ